MFPCAQTTNILCTGRTEIIRYERSFPVLPLRLQCPVQMVTALEDKEAFPSQTQSFTAGLGLPVPLQSWEMPSISNRGGPSLGPQNCWGLGCLCHICHFSFALLMTKLPPSLICLVWVFLELSLALMRDLYLKVVPQSAADRAEVLLMTIQTVPGVQLLIYFFTSRAIEKKNKHGIFCPSHKHLAIHILVIFNEWLLLNMPSEFWPHLRFNWCLNFPVMIEADFLTIAALCWQTRFRSSLPDLHRPICQEVFAKDALCTRFVFWVKPLCALMLCISFELNFNCSIFNLPPF